MPRALLVRYLQDAEAAERNFDNALAGFSNDQDDVQRLLTFMSGKARSQHERLRKRIAAAAEMAMFEA